MASRIQTYVALTSNVLAALIAVLNGCTPLDPRTKVECNSTPDCLNDYVCVDRVCIWKDDVPLHGGDGDGDGDHGGDVDPPAPVTFMPAGGTINIATDFDCVRVLGIEPDGHAEYMQTEGSDIEPMGMPDGTLTADDNEICDFVEGGNAIRVIAYDEAGNASGSVGTTFYVDRIAPSAPSAPASGFYAAADMNEDMADIGGGHARLQVQGERTAKIYYELSSDGSEPLDPTLDSPDAQLVLGSTGSSAKFQILELARAGETILKLWQVDEAGNPSEVITYTYELDIDVFEFTFSPFGGSFNIFNAFDCITLEGIEPGGRVLYDLNGNTPTELSESASAESPVVCGVARHGHVTVSLSAEDAAGNRGPTETAEYYFDLVRPVIDSFTHDVATGIGYLYHPILFRLKTSKNGHAWVQLGERSLELNDDGEDGDDVADDGWYALEYRPQPGDHLARTVPLAHAEDAASNESESVAATAIAIDTDGSPLPNAVTSAFTCRAQDAPCAIEDNVTVQEGVTLTIEAGAVLSFAPDARLIVVGELQVLGSAEDPIIANDGDVRLAGSVDFAPSFDSNGNYVIGHRIEGLQMPHGAIGVISGYGRMFVRGSNIGSVTGYTFEGALIERSTIGSLRYSPAEFAYLRGSWLLNSYFGTLAIEGSSGSAGLRIEDCAIDGMTLYRWRTDSSFTANTVNSMLLLGTPGATVFSAHGNNFGLDGTSLILQLGVYGTQGTGTHDLTGNYWGTAATTQMVALGNNADIDAIEDVRDNPDLDGVNYSGFATLPFENAGPDWD